jgi:hypothetical protein
MILRLFILSPAGYKAYVSEREQAFEAELKKQREASL